MNLLDDARTMGLSGPVFAVIGGLHLYTASDATLAWTADRLKKAGVRFLLAGHCTGIEATMRLRAGAGMTRSTAAYGGDGATFALRRGIDAGEIGR